MASLKDQYVDAVPKTGKIVYGFTNWAEAGHNAYYAEVTNLTNYAVEGTEFGAEDVEALAEGYCRFDTTATSGTDYELMQLISDLGWADVIVTE